MGDRGGTATSAGNGTAHIHCSRCEIGEEPQLFSHVYSEPPNCSRWEIGEEPQLYWKVTPKSVDCSRWEIGEEPQQPVIDKPPALIVADGRSERNRNAAGTGTAPCLQCAPLHYHT